VLQIVPKDGEEFLVIRLCSNAEEIVDEPPLADNISLLQPPDLTFPNQMHRLVTVDRSQGSFHRPKPQARCNPFLYKSMVLLNDVV
jgi:hypothetical protein